MKRFTGVFTVITLTVLLSMVVVFPVLAQDEWECVYDFTESDYSFTNFVIGEYTPEVGFTDTFVQLSNGYRGVGIVYEFPAVTTLTSASVTFDYTAGTLDETTLDYSFILSGSTDPNENILIGIFPPATGVSPETWEGEQPGATGIFLTIQGGFLGGPASGDPGGDVTLTELALTGEGTSPCGNYSLTYPIAQQNRTLVTESFDALAGTYVTADVPETKVSAALSGTVTGIRQFTQDDCQAAYLTSNPGFCTVSYEGGIYTLVGSYIDNWIVEITGSLLTTEQLVMNAPIYVQEGQEITAGCWIGETVNLNPLVYLPGSSTPAITILWSRDTGYIPNSPNTEPVDSAPCNRPDSYEGCLADSTLSDPTAWQTTGGVTWQYPGATLAPGAGISALMTLDSDREPEMLVKGIAFGGTLQTLRLQLGTTAANIDLTSQTPTIPADTHAPDAGAFFTVSVRNTGQAIVRLDYVCVRHTLDDDGNPVDPPDDDDPDSPGGPPPEQSVCTFSNSSFNNGTTGWTVVNGESGAGEILLQTTGTIAQNITVAAGTYDLTVVTSIWSYNSYSPDDQDTDDIDLEYDFGAGFVALDTYTYGEFAQNNNVVVYQTSVVVGSDTTDDFIIQAALNSPPTGVRGIAIRSVCLGHGTGGSGGYDPGETGGGLFEATCTTISTPTGNNISTWISWLWAKLNQFYRCELMVLLNNMFQVIQEQYRLFQWSLLYQQAASQSVLTWFGGDFVNWLGGHFTNIAQGRVTTIATASGNCDNLFCALDSLFSNIGDVLNNLLSGIQALGEGLINLGQTLLDGLIPPINRIVDTLLLFFGQVAGVLFGTLNLALTILYTLIAQIIALVMLGLSLLNAILIAWNTAVPIPLPGVPTCTTAPQSNPLCIGIWVLENTVFSSDAGALIIPLVTGIMAIHMLIWVVERLRRAAVEGANAV